MADCPEQIGIRNILMTFKDCDNNITYGPLSHELAGEEQPSYRMCDYSNEPLPGGYIRRTRGNNEITVNVIRNLGVPLAMYQGCASINITLEHFNGLVVTGIAGTSTGDEGSDGHEVTITATFKEIDELLPTSAQNAA